MQPTRIFSESSENLFATPHRNGIYSVSPPPLRRRIGFGGTNDDTHIPSLLTIQPVKQLDITHIIVEQPITPIRNKQQFVYDTPQKN